MHNNNNNAYPFLVGYTTIVPRVGCGPSLFVDDGNELTLDLVARWW